MFWGCGLTTATDIEVLKLKRIRVRTEIAFLRNYECCPDHDEQERALKDELHGLDDEIEKAEILLH